MYTKRMKILTALAATSVFAAAAYASNVHFKKGSPQFADLGLVLQSSGKLAGLGNGDIIVVLTATGDPEATCTNPSGQNRPPGQNPAEVVLTGVDAIPEEEIKNGTVSFNVTTGAPETPVPGAPDCPNEKWTEDIVDVEFTSATLEIYQGGELVLSTQVSPP